MKSKAYTFNTVAANGGCIRNFKLPEDCKKINTVMVFFENPASRNICAGTVSVLFNDKSSPCIADVPVYFSTDAQTQQQINKSNEIPLLQTIDAQKNNAIIWKNSNELNTLIAAGTVANTLNLALIVNYYD